MSQDRLDSSNSRDSIFGPESLKLWKVPRKGIIFGSIIYTMYCIKLIIRPFFPLNLILMKCFSDQRGMSQDPLDSSHSRESIFGPKSLEGTEKRNHIRFYFYSINRVWLIIWPFFPLNFNHIGNVFQIRFRMSCGNALHFSTQKQNI